METVFDAVKQEGICLEGKLTTFRNIVKKLGFTWRKTKDNRMVLIEKSEIRSKRTDFFATKIKKYREGRNIVYNDETYLHSSHTSPYGWDDGSGKCLRAPVGKRQRLIILHCSGAKGFVPNALFTFKPGKKTGHDHDDMNHKNYIKWLEEKLIPKLEPNSVLIIDNASYHNVTVLPNPTSSWKKANMQE
jgi:hypothetical protein